jgi:hypothetical protein
MNPAIVRFSAVAALSACLLPPARGQERVQISGGNDGSGQNYQWTVVNRHTSPIVAIEFPHYQADTFITPDGWQQKCTHLAVIGSENRPGECRGFVESPERGIAPGSSGAFGMRLARISAQKGRRAVNVTFADGSTVQVAGVVLPVPPSVWDQYLVPIAMGLLFLLAFLFHWRRKRRGEASGPGQPLEST